VSAEIILCFESALRASRERVWEWISSVEGIQAEMRPWLRMTAPRNLRSLADVPFQPGVRMFRSTVFLLGVLPIDFSDLTLLELDDGSGFVEQSPMGSMALWRHERRIVPCEDDPSAVRLVDRLTFQARLGGGLVRWFIGRVFTHRHAVLRATFGDARSPRPARRSG
jgi:ligand-binding SRPBCC domain-containing protein